MEQFKLIKRAIFIGILLIKIPTMILIVVACYAFYLYLPISSHIARAVLMFPCGISVAWLYWGVSVVHWRMWAYHKIDDIQTLINWAVESNIINEKNSFLNRTEIRTPYQSMILNDLEEKSYSYVIKNDLSLPKMYVVNYSKITSLIQFILGLSFIVFGVWAILVDKDFNGELHGTIAKYVGIPLGMYVLFLWVKKVKRPKTPPLILTDTKIYIFLEEQTEIPWNAIRSFDKKKLHSNDFELVIETKDATYTFPNEFDKNLNEIIYVSKIYQNHFCKYFLNL